MARLFLELSEDIVIIRRVNELGSSKRQSQQSGLDHKRVSRSWEKALIAVT